MKWYQFDEAKGYRQKRPPIKKWVLLRIRKGLPDGASGMPDGFALGYRKDSAGDKSCPYFVIPGIGGKVISWCDCLPQEINREDGPPNHLWLISEKG